MNLLAIFFIPILLLAAPLHLAARPDSSGPFSPQLKQNKGGSGAPGWFGPMPDFGVPGLGKGWGNFGSGYGAGSGGPSGGYSKGGVIKSSVVCKQKGPCYNKMLTCPAKCFTSYSRSGKGYGGGGGGGGCTMDCKKKCIAYC